MNRFHSDCQNAIDKIPLEIIEQFNNAKDPESKIKLIYEYANKIPVNIEASKKDLAIAEAQKAKGNSFFAKKDYQNAIKSYNSGIRCCPQNEDSSREILSILIANRSATLFELKEYRKVLNDIDYLMEVDKYPKHLLHKILIRKAKCYDALHNEKSANEVYNQAYDSFKHTGLDKVEITKKIEEIKANRQKLKDTPVCLELTPTVYEEIFTPSDVYIASNNKINFEEDMTQGRFARATEDLPAGQLIIQENPHSSVLAPENASTNCQHCLISTAQIVACPKCPFVVFCSSNCERMANRTYHKIECGFQETLFKSGASINCALALRIISQKDLGFFKEKMKSLRDYMRDNCKKTFKKIKPYRAEDYNTVFFLCRNEFSRDKEELLHFTCMSIFLMKLLRTGNYFPKDNSSENNLTADETLICCLMLRHLELLQFNCHEIAELRNTENGNKTDDDSWYKLEYIGAALYPTAALFNHSCDPSIVRYNIKNKIIVRTIKPIKRGEIIYENYGPIYTTMKREYRQKFLAKRYWFDCFCTPCSEYWPLLEKMDDNELRISCAMEECPYIFAINKIDVDPFLVCEYCGSRTNLFPILKKLMELQSLLPNAEHYYETGKFEEAIKLYLSALHILYQYLRPPCPDMVKIQQRLRTCFINYGNKSLDYTYSTSLVLQ